MLCHKMLLQLKLPFSLRFAVFLLIRIPPRLAMQIDISVDCHSDAENMIVQVKTDLAFQGLVYVSSHYGDSHCTSRGTTNTTTVLRVPFKGCNTTEKKPGLLMNHVTVQQHPMIISIGDGEYEVGCQMFKGDFIVNSSGDEVNINSLDSKELSPVSGPKPDVMLRIYDFENDIFVDKVRLGQIVELEVTIRDGRRYQGRLEDCDATSENGTVFPVIRNYCPVDLSVSDKVYVDDQSRTTGDYYLYIPFRMFRFLEGAKVSFTCNVIICQHDCPWADCGDYQGMSYGRKKRSVTTEESPVKLTVTSAVQVVDADHRTPRASGIPVAIVEEDISLPKSPTQKSDSSSQTRQSSFSIPTEYLVGGVSLVLGLLISVSVNVFMLIFIRRRLRQSDDNSESGLAETRTPFFSRASGRRYDSLYESTAPRDIFRFDRDWNSGQPYRYESEWNLSPRLPRYETYPERHSFASNWIIKPDNREILYPPMPIRQAQSTRRSHSFRY